ncbi:MAG: acyl-[acyl-carrier-protein]--UDP-N-acetylglucosamine O-acyltransferase [Candidatus Marinimicrobia bacterium]|nr:acyl-[acyl-carrier-protein]--UDP-N-acetylglucosamine O-acyltransferase [Candidatus Neomarinimicrobiota bacterium]|tara:strand:+ start:18164 stop:18925 length:762 start_codon:yes stop_codon:yes gene_type:complete
MYKNSIISPKSNIDTSVEIGPFCIIEDNVSINKNCKIHSHVIIKSGTSIGQDCEIFSGAVLGEVPQDLKYNNEETKLKIGKNNIIREYVTIHRGTADRKITEVGNNCMLMAYSHIAHDCIIKNNVILSNGVQVGGHVDIDDFVIVGGATPIHQFCKLGKFSFIGGGYRVVQDVPPYIKAMGEPLKYFGVNSIGLSRNQFSSDQISLIKKVYKILYRSEYNISQAVDILNNNYSGNEQVNEIINFIDNSNRGII